MNKKIILPIIAILIVAGIAIMYQYTPTSISQEGDITIVDMVGRTVTIPVNIQKIVATSPPMTSMIYVLAPEKLGGMNYNWTEEELKYVPDEYKTLAIVGGWFGRQDGNYEEIIAISPDLVIEGAMGDTDRSIVNERQEKFGTIPVVGVRDTSNVSSIDSSIEFMGKLLGTEDKASKLIEFRNNYYSKVENVVNSLSDEDKKRVYYAEGEEGLQTDPSGTYHSQLIDVCGGINVADVPVQEGVGQVEVSMEQVIKWNPEIIITTDSKFYQNVYNNSKWADIEAVKNKQVYLSPSSPFKWFDRPPGVNVIIGIPWTAKIIYPEKFTDISLKTLTKEFYSEFYHYNLNDDEVLSLLKNSGLKEENM
jgi:iron complex transport system substrate-binding protein